MTNPAPPVDDARVHVKALLAVADNIVTDRRDAHKIRVAAEWIAAHAPSPTADEARTLLADITAEHLDVCNGRKKAVNVILLGRAGDMIERLLSRVPSEEATEEEIESALSPSFFTREVLGRLNAAGLRITRAPGAKT
jgi:hypothetical protein